MSAPRHELCAPRYRNERKRVVFERWLRLGLVQINFDATRDDVVVPDRFKDDPDYWLALVEADVYSSHVDGRCVPRDKRMKAFDFSVPWDAVHAMYSQALHERHIWLEDVNRSAKRAEIRKMVKTGRPLPS